MKSQIVFLKESEIVMDDNHHIDEQKISLTVGESTVIKPGGSVGSYLIERNQFGYRITRLSGSGRKVYEYVIPAYCTAKHRLTPNYAHKLRDPKSEKNPLKRWAMEHKVSSSKIELVDRIEGEVIYTSPNSTWYNYAHLATAGGVEYHVETDGEDGEATAQGNRTIKNGSYVIFYNTIGNDFGRIYRRINKVVCKRGGEQKTVFMLNAILSMNTEEVVLLRTRLEITSKEQVEILCLLDKLK